jgi:hypothetical protein
VKFENLLAIQSFPGTDFKIGEMVHVVIALRSVAPSRGITNQQLKKTPATTTLIRLVSIRSIH